MWKSDGKRLAMKRDMKTISMISVGAMFVLLSGCGSSSPTNQNASANLTNNPSLPVTEALATIQNNNQTVAYVISIGQDTAEVYIPSADRYANIHLSTGQYVDQFAYFSGQNCTGSAYSDVPGPLGKGIAYINGAYYQTSSAIPPSQITIGSMYQGANGVCEGISETIDNFGGSSTLLVQTSRPYDFTSLAPLNLSYQ